MAKRLTVLLNMETTHSSSYKGNEVRRNTVKYVNDTFINTRVINQADYMILAHKTR